MPTYGQHICLYLEKDVTIEKWAGNWFIFFLVKMKESNETELGEFIIRFCPFCGEKLD